MLNRLELYLPVKPFNIYQDFYGNKACIENNELPLEKRKVIGVATNETVCPVGYTKLYPLLGMKSHGGYDVPVPMWTPVYSPIDGVVKEVQTELERGLGLGIITNERVKVDEWGEHYYKDRHWHFIALNVGLNDKVSRGDLIGYADSTGISGGSHLHWEGKPIEYDSSGNHYNIFQNNGNFGCIPIDRFFIKSYAADTQKIKNILIALVSALEALIEKLTKK